MRVKQLGKSIFAKHFEALEDGIIITSAGDHPGCPDIKLFVKKNQDFWLLDSYVSRNGLSIVSK